MDEGNISINPGPESRKRPAPRGTAAYVRKRAVAACQICRSRKTKCDNRRPSCSFCEGAGAVCIYSEFDLSAYDPASLAILDRLGQLENNLKAHISSGPSPLLPAPHVLPITPVTSHVSQPTSVHHDNNGPEVDSPLLLNTVENVLTWPVFRGRYDAQTRLVQLLRQSVPLEQPTSVNFDLDMSTCEHLMKQCFEHVLSKNPVLEEDSLRKTMHSVCLNGIGWDAQSCLVLLVCALGCIASLDARRVHWDMARSYFGAAQRRIGMLIVSDSPIVPQCYFLAGVFFMYNLRPLEAWRMFAQAVVYIQPNILETRAPGIYSLTECIHWACWKSEVELRMHLQIPSFGIIENRYPQHFPEPPATETSREPKWFYYLADISLRRLDMTIREVVATILGRNTSAETRYIELALVLPTFEQQLQDWVVSMPDVFNVHDPEESILNSIVKGRLLDTYDVLYLPFLAGALATHSLSHKVTTVVDTYARKALDCCVRRSLEDKPGYEIRHHGTWLMLRACTRSALMLLAARVAARVDILPQRWQNAVTTTVSVLELWKDESCDTADRLTIIRALIQECDMNVVV